MKSELELLRTLAEAEEDVVNGRVSVTPFRAYLRPFQVLCKLKNLI